MTAVEHGGGPTLEQKRAFSCLREGAHVPGYVWNWKHLTCFLKYKACIYVIRRPAGKEDYLRPSEHIGLHLIGYLLFLLQLHQK